MRFSAVRSVEESKKTVLLTDLSAIFGRQVGWREQEDCVINRPECDFRVSGRLKGAKSRLYNRPRALFCGLGRLYPKLTDENRFFYFCR